MGTLCVFLQCHLCRVVGNMGHGEMNRSQEWIVTVLLAFQLSLFGPERRNLCREGCRHIQTFALVCWLRWYLSLLWRGGKCSFCLWLLS